MLTKVGKERSKDGMEGMEGRKEAARKSEADMMSTGGRGRTGGAKRSPFQGTRLTAEPSDRERESNAQTDYSERNDKEPRGGGGMSRGLRSEFRFRIGRPGELDVKLFQLFEFSSGRKGVPFSHSVRNDVTSHHPPPPLQAKAASIDRSIRSAQFEFAGPIPIPY